MYISFRNNTKPKKNKRELNTNLTLKHKKYIDDSSLNEKNTDFNNISKILKKYGSERIKKKHFKLISYKQKESLDTNINRECENEGNEKDKVKLSGKIFNNNTYNTTLNILYFEGNKPPPMGIFFFENWGHIF